MEEKKTAKGKVGSYKHIVPLNWRVGTLRSDEDPLVPIAACDCDGHCDHTQVCVVGDVPVDADVCGVWG